MDLNEELISLAAEIITYHKIFGLTVQSVPPTDDRVSCQIEVFDIFTGKKYAVQANGADDIRCFLPRLLTTLRFERELHSEQK